MLPSVGLASTPSNVVLPMPERSSDSTMRSANPARRTPASVSTSACVIPRAFASSPVRSDSPGPKTTRVGKLQIAMSHRFEVTTKLPVRHGAFVRARLPPAGCNVVFDESRTEDLLRDAALRQKVRGVLE